MKALKIILALGMVIRLGACAPKQTESSPTDDFQEDNALEEKFMEAAIGISAVQVEAEDDETSNAPQMVDAIEVEEAPRMQDALGTEDDVESIKITGKSIQMDVSALCPQEGLWGVGGNKVYYGHYEGIPVAYRILAPSEVQTVENERPALLLDCDYTLLTREYDADGKKNDTQEKRQNQWKGSDLEDWLNGSDFLENTDVFSTLEKETIVSVTLAENATGYFAGKWTYDDFESTDRVFLLSAQEANHLYIENSARIKAGTQVNWWLRSAFAEAGNGVGVIHSDGHICNNSVNNYSVGVSPAFNLALDHILFASISGFDKSLELSEEASKVTDTTSNRWKVTLLDPDKTVEIAENGTIEKNQEDTKTMITVPYNCTGNGITQISIMITDKPYIEQEAMVLYYGALTGIPNAEGTGSGTFILPTKLQAQTCGKDYYAYLIAEEINGSYETDYASEPYEILIL